MMLSQKQHLVGATLLIAGCCIGGGMLGLPLATALAGFLPSSLLLLFAWLFMMSGGLLLAEVYLYFKDDIGLRTMARRTLGPLSAKIAWILFLFLFYTLLIAYVSALGTLLGDFSLTYWNYAPPRWFPTTLITALIGVFLYFGTEKCDLINRAMMIGLIVSFFLLISLAFPHIERENLAFSDWTESLFILPTFIVSFGFHNLIPDVGAYLKHNVKKIRLAIFLGSFIPFILYFVWQWCMLGIIPIEGEGGYREALEYGSLAPQMLRQAVGYSLVSEATNSFALFAILTSFLAVALSITDFWVDGLKLSKKRPLTNLFICFITLVPPLLIGLTDPTLFLFGLKHAGGVGAVALYCLLPALMAWRGRYTLQLSKERSLPGGKVTLAGMIGVSLGAIILHLYTEFM